MTPKEQDRGAGKKTPWFVRLILFFICVMLFGIGWGLLSAGTTAITTRHHESSWRQTTGASFLKQTTRGTYVYEGTDAIRVGIGYSAGGVMLGIWGLALLGQAVTGLVRLKLRSDSWVVRALRMISFLALIVAAFCFFPLWSASGMLMWTVVALAAWVPIVLRRKGHAKRISTFFIGLIVTGLVVGSMSSRFAVCIPFGILVTVIGGAHVLLLVPSLQKKVDEINAAEAC